MSPRPLLDTFVSARARLNEDLTSPEVRQPRVIVLHTRLHRWVAAPVNSEVARAARRRERRTLARVGRSL